MGCWKKKEKEKQMREFAISFFRWGPPIVPVVWASHGSTMLKKKDSEM